MLFPLLLIDRGFAYSDWTNQFITAFEQKLQTMDANQQKDYFKLIQSILDAPQVKNNSKAEIKGLVSELNIRLQSKS